LTHQRWQDKKPGIIPAFFISGGNACCSCDSNHEFAMCILVMGACQLIFHAVFADISSFVEESSCKFGQYPVSARLLIIAINRFVYFD